MTAALYVARGWASGIQLHASGRHTRPRTDAVDRHVVTRGVYRCASSVLSVRNSSDLSISEHVPSQLCAMDITKRMSATAALAKG